MCSIDNIDNLPQIKLDNDFNVDLSFLADLASADFSPENMRYSSIASSSASSSTNSSGYGSPINPLEDSLLNASYQYSAYNYSPQYVAASPAVASPQAANNHFFPQNFNPEDVWNQHYNNYMAGNQVDQANSSFQLSSISKSSLKMKRKRASRSKCPCVKCCSARVNGFPSPISHSCSVKNCTKSYTRPAHLRSHLKSHENQGTLKCDMCNQAFMKAEMLINHMFEHGNEMRLF